MKSCDNLLSLNVNARKRRRIHQSRPPLRLLQYSQNLHQLLNQSPKSTLNSSSKSRKKSLARFACPTLRRYQRLMMLILVSISDRPRTHTKGRASQKYCAWNEKNSKLKSKLPTSQLLRSNPPNLLKLKLKHKLNHSQQLSLSLTIVWKVARHVCKHRDKPYSRSADKSVRKSWMTTTRITVVLNLTQQETASITKW